jgi:tetratricopeptide (TPR) repeat protein
MRAENQLCVIRALKRHHGAATGTRGHIITVMEDQLGGRVSKGAKRWHNRHVAAVGTVREDVSRILYQAWLAGPRSESARRLASQIPVPGSVALRGRFHFLTDPAVPDLPAAMFEVTWDVWQRQVELTAAADAALMAHDVAVARRALAELQSTHVPGRHQLPLVDALVGMGDAARQADLFEEAAGHYDGALGMAAEEHYRFGTVRALVPVGYLTLMSGSAREAADRFRAAASLARELDERAYLAGALTGSGEALSRLREDAAARESLAEALQLAESLKSDGGIVNAAQQLGDLHRRRRELTKAREYFGRALEVAHRAGPWIGEVNASDGLGEVHLRLGEVDEAIRHYEHARALSVSKRYRRGEAHALNGIGWCADAAGDWEAAELLHHAALDAYRELGDLPSSTHALVGMAQAATKAGDRPRALGAMLNAVAAIEAMRSAQDRHQHQHEYRERFAIVYSGAIRAAVDADDPAGFVAVFESLAGRRLAGMLEPLPTAAVEEAQLAAHVLATAQHRPLRRSHRSGADPAPKEPGTAGTSAESGATERTRLLGRLALRHGMQDIVERAMDDIAAALYRPFAPDDAAPLLQRVAAHQQLLLVTPLPGQDTEIAWLRSGPGIDTRVGTHVISDQARDLVVSLAQAGLPALARPGLLAPLAGLLPQSVMADLDEIDLLIVPLGPLWAVPWTALPGPATSPGGSFLGERCALAVAPSMTLADHVRRHGDPAGLKTVGHWRSPAIRYHKLVAYADDARVQVDELACAADGLTAVTQARHDLLVLAGHGRPVPGLGHYLELGDDVLLTPVSLLSARTPDRLVLTACWGAHTPGIPEADPLTLATIALTRGSRSIIATTSELADDAPATTFLNRVLYRLPGQPMPTALREVTRRFLSEPYNRDGYLSRWAPLITVGTV